MSQFLYDSAEVGQKLEALGEPRLERGLKRRTDASVTEALLTASE
jgi:hypothetical protein